GRTTAQVRTGVPSPVPRIARMAPRRAALQAHTHRRCADRRTARSCLPCSLRGQQSPLALRAHRRPDAPPGGDRQLSCLQSRSARGLRSTAAAAHLYASLKLAGLVEAPVHLAVFVDEGTEQGNGLGRKTMAETLHYSAVTAVHGFWLAARVHDIGVGWVS